MTNASGKNRTDSASGVIKASPQTIYKAFVDPGALVSWLPPKGMKGHIYEFDTRVGGAYRMSLTRPRSMLMSSKGDSWSSPQTSELCR
ncbi:SRPBCC domain-containing protein [Paenibacillus solisilvae]|uniref:SRPBCC domain-containing protein n=1 Tax=Paenibacillus solisilvae TaxID=2486751 RepID=A0ABW0W1N6_9BACL